MVTGADLKRIREARGISLRDIALQSKIGMRILEYIEEDRLPYLPAPVYLRGFLQEYARAVGLDPREGRGFLHGAGSPSGAERRSLPSDRSAS